MWSTLYLIPSDKDSEVVGHGYANRLVSCCMIRGMQEAQVHIDDNGRASEGQYGELRTERTAGAALPEAGAV